MTHEKVKNLQTKLNFPLELTITPMFLPVAPVFSCIYLQVNFDLCSQFALVGEVLLISLLMPLISIAFLLFPCIQTSIGLLSPTPICPLYLQKNLFHGEISDQKSLVPPLAVEVQIPLHIVQGTLPFQVLITFLVLSQIILVYHMTHPNQTISAILSLLTSFLIPIP